MPVVTDICVETSLWNGLSNHLELVETAVAACVRHDAQAFAETCELSVLLCDDERISALNKQWRGIDSPTNVLSFPTTGPDAARFLGDIAVAFETVAREATRDGKKLADHFVHLIVHGFLHLKGFDHIDDDDAAVMEGLEKDILAGLGLDDPYAVAERNAGAA